MKPAPYRQRQRQPHHAIATAFLSAAQFGNSIARSMDSPGPHNHPQRWRQTAVVECTLSPEGSEEKALRVGRLPDEATTVHRQQPQAPNAPLPTSLPKTAWHWSPSSSRATPTSFIGHSLAHAPATRALRLAKLPQPITHTHGHDAAHSAKSAQVKMVGNSVKPLPLPALTRVNPAGAGLSSWSGPGRESHPH